MLRSKLIVLLIFLSFAAKAQEKTVFITSETEEIEPEKIDYGLTFSQFALSLPFRANPRNGEVAAYEEEREPWFLIDGISFHGGLGVHLNAWAGVSANTGLDWRITEKLVSVPVYGSVVFNPQFGDTSLLLQAGYGKSFALGRGDLSGDYQKYRLGIMFDNEICLFIDASLFGYPLHDTPQMGSFTFGISLFNFK